MGDIVHAIPAVSALRRALPQADIGWVVDRRWAPLLAVKAAVENKPHASSSEYLVDRVHCTDMKKWKRNLLSPATWRALSDVRRATQQADYEMAIDLQGLFFASAALGRFCGPEELIGDSRPRESLARWFYRRSIQTQGVHVVEQAHEIVCGALGQNLPLEAPILPHDTESERWVAETLSARKVQKLVLMNPGAGWGAKCWPVDRYSQVAKDLRHAGCSVLANVGPGEEVLGEQLRTHSDGAAVPVSCTVGQLIALCRRACLFIGGDTGPMHVAAALRVPVVAIFGPTDPRRNGPFATRSRVLRHPSSRRDHSRRSQPESGLLEIPAADVFQAAKELLEGGA